MKLPLSSRIAINYLIYFILIVLIILSGVPLYLYVTREIEDSQRNKSADASMDLKVAARYLAEAQQNCVKDQGHLWGKSLCGPIMLVDPKTREIVANQPDANGQLQAVEDVFIGWLPYDKNVFNTNVEWSGVKWAQIMWPPSKDEAFRKEVFMHELFHRIQPELGFKFKQCLNPQLGTLEGRYLLDLEWRALQRALVTSGESQRQAIQDALLFRGRRHEEFPGSAWNETMLEQGEGTASYTGVKLGTDGAHEQALLAIRLIDQQFERETVVRTFAYATGPAYGLLLDQYVPDWKPLVRRGSGMDEILEAGLGWHPDGDLAGKVGERALSYNGQALRTTEVARETRHQKQFSTYRAALVENPVLKLPARAHAVSLVDPTKVFEFEDLGSVYGSLRVVADWGTLDVSKSALMGPDRNWYVVPAPFKTDYQSANGDGWTLQLKDGWKIVPGLRPGDFQLELEKNN